MQLEFFDIPSPCVGICQSDEKGHCKGCMRTRDERLQWVDFSTIDKQKVIKRCQQRKKRKGVVLKNKVLDAKEEEKVVQPSLLDPTSPIDTKPPTDFDFGDFEL